MRPLSSRFAVLPFSILALGVVTHAALAQIVTDGTLGKARTLNGPDYAISSTLGRVYGKNLFHSFRDFNLSSGESATFSGPASIANILARVTGGKASSLNGSLNSTIAGANFFFVNPSGVVFGPNAQINVGGSFLVTTADVIKMRDGGTFGAQNPATSVLSSASPVSFGFLGARPAPITLSGAQLRVGSNRALSFLGGDLQVTGATLGAASGQVNLMSVESAGQINLDADNAGATPTLSGFTKEGTIRLNASNVDVSDDVALASGGMGGNVNVNAGNLLMGNNSLITAKNTGATTGGAIHVGVKGLLRLENQSSISASNEGNGRGTSIEVEAGKVEIEGPIVLGPRTPTGIASLVSPDGSGQGGDVSVESQSITLNNGARISASTNGTANGGNLVIKAPNILMDGGDTPDFTGFAAQTTSLSGGGEAGNVSVEAQTLRIRNGAEISASTFGSGRGGNIAVNAAEVTLDGQTSPYPTGVFAGTFAFSGGGQGGNVTVNTQALRIVSGAEINVDTQGSGRGGNITVNADNIALDRLGSSDRTGLIAQTLASDGGKGGSITVNAKTLTLRGSAEISANTTGSGAGGDIAVNAENITVDGAGNDERTGISANTESESQSAKGGSIAVNSKSLRIVNGGIITAFTSGGADGGNINIKADNITLSGGDTPRFTGISTQTAKTAAGGRGGNVNIAAQNLVIADGAEISSSSFGSGQGGDIVIAAPNITLDGRKNGFFTGIAAGTYAFTGGGRGGSIEINAQNLQIVSGATVLASTKGSGDGGKIDVKSNTLLVDGRGMETGIEAESAESESGRGGNIEIQARNLTLKRIGSISANTMGTGAGGNISLSGDTLKLDSQGLISTGTTGAGKGGNIQLNSGEITMNAASVTSSAQGVGNAGSIEVKASGSVNLSRKSSLAVTSQQSDGGSISLAAGGSLRVSGSSISAQAAGDGGQVILNVGRLISVKNGELSARAGGTGGNITSGAHSIVFDRSRILADAVRGNGGNILLRSRVFLLSVESVIDVSSQFAVAGNIAIESPNTNIGGSLVILPSRFLDAESYLSPNCVVRTTGASSSFTVDARHGVPTQPGDLVPSPGIQK